MRIAVVLLGFAIGWCLEAFAEVRSATVFGLLGGMLAANFVPMREGCDRRGR